MTRELGVLARARVEAGLPVDIPAGAARQIAAALREVPVNVPSALDSNALESSAIRTAGAA